MHLLSGTTPARLPPCVPHPEDRPTAFPEPFFFSAISLSSRCDREHRRYYLSARGHIEAGIPIFLDFLFQLFDLLLNSGDFLQDGTRFFTPVLFAVQIFFPVWSGFFGTGGPLLALFPSNGSPLFCLPDQSFPVDAL